VLDFEGVNMAQRKRIQKNTIAGAIQTTKAILAKISPAYELNSFQSEYFERVVKSRETSSWDDNHILLATNLAVNYAQIDEANTDIAERGLMTKSDKGTPVVNPAVTAKASLMSTVLQLNKALGLSASQMGVSGKDQDSRNKADRDARNILEKAALEDDLI
jgi:P27 family predicted phage terminase small subunit